MKIRSEKGASVGEFGIVVGLVAVAAVGVVFGAGEQIRSVFSGTDDVLNDPLSSQFITAGPGEETPAGPPPFDPDAYGLDMTGWLMGTPNVDSLALSGEPGVMALESDDTITGDATGAIIIGAPGNDTITDPNGDDTYYYRPGDGSDTITEYYSGYDQTGQNEFIFQEISSEDVTLGRIADTENATITLSDGSVITLVNGASGSYRHGINTFTFDDTNWNRQTFRDQLVEDQKATGVVVGSTAVENYVHRLADGSYTVYDYNQYDFQKGDKFTFESIQTDEVAFSASGDDVIVTMSDGDTVTFVQARQNYNRTIPSFVFADETYTRREFSSRLVEDMKPTGTVIGSVNPEDYIYTLGDGSFTIDDYNTYDFQKGDTFTFDGIATSDVVLGLDGNNFTATFTDGAVVTFIGARANANRMIPTWIFSDATLNRNGMYSKLTDDQKGSGAVVGTGYPESYVHEAGDGSYTVSDYNSYDFQKSDTFTFIGFDVADATLAPSGNDFTITLNNGEVITMLGARTASNRMLPTWNFDDANYNRTDMYSKLVNDQKSTGTVLGSVYLENYRFDSGDGSFTLTDYNSYDWQKSDTFTFTSLSQSDVSVARVGNDMVLTVPGGVQVTVDRGADARYLPPTWTFTDGSLNAQGLRNKSVADQVSSGTVRATRYREDFVHAEGDGSYTVQDNAVSYDWQQVDTFTFTNLPSTSVTITNSGGDMLMTTAGGDQIRFINGASGGRYRVNTITFSDGVVYDMATQASFL